jgi:putative ABC transport system ATP-binding protein
MTAFVDVENMTKLYTVGEVAIRAAAGISMKIGKGEFAVVVGPSGAGKSTVLNILGGMDTPTSGRVTVDGDVISEYDRLALTAYRRNEIGFVFQFYNLVPNLTALENVELALQICRDPLDPMDTLRAVGLEDRVDNFPAQLSGGEQQRVSIARAIAKNPKLLLCDEPTGALDCDTGKTVLALLREACRTQGKTVIVVTHNLAIAPIADRVIHIRGGVVSAEQRNENPVPVDTIEW